MKNEKFKYKLIKKNIEIKNKNILQSKCGLGMLLDNFKVECNWIRYSFL